MDSLVRMSGGASAQAAATPAAPAASRQDKAPHRLVDVAQFHNLPLAGTPTVSAAEDATLVAMDPVNKLLTRLQTKGALLNKGITGYRVSTDATPSQRFFAKVGFVLGMAGFLFGTVAMLSSMPVMAGVARALPWLLPATKISNTVGIVGLFAWAGQLFLGKNAWLNRHARGMVMG